MAQPTPIRNRPNFHLALTQLTGSPRQQSPGTPLASSSLSTPRYSPAGTPYGRTSYSPYHSVSLKPPTPSMYGDQSPFTPRRSSCASYGSYGWFRFRRTFATKFIWFFLILAALVVWLSNGSGELDVVRFGASGLGREFLSERKLHDHQFYPASNPKIHYVGRWTSTPNRLRKDGTFPGVYFDISVKNTTSLLLALHNALDQELNSPGGSISARPSTSGSAGQQHYHFRPLSNNERPAPPISLLAQIDDQEYVLLPKSSSLVSVRSNDLDPNIEHYIRIVAPMTDDHGTGIIELEGLWLSKGGQLVKVAGSLLSEDYVDEDQLRAENDLIGEKHRAGLNDIGKEDGNKIDYQDKIGDDHEILAISQDRKKILEVITDSLGSFTGKQSGRRTGGADGLLGGVMGWEYLLGEMFGADHVSIGADGMCLTQDCIGGTGQPAGLGDVFFRSGPSGSFYFDHSWMFDAYIPDVLIINIGGADEQSFIDNLSDYNKSFFDLSSDFEATYISLIKAIRNLAYPKHPNIVQSERIGTPGMIPSSAPATIPIFIMRPLRGQLEQATQNIVTQLRADGDKSVFWLDTSGWLDPDAEGEGIADFFLDNTAQPPRYRLTEQGNQRVAIFLHMHTCRYLAGAEEKCAFLPQEVYQGKVFNEEEARFDKFLEDAKEMKLKKLFWEDEGAVGIEEKVVELLR